MEEDRLCMGQKERDRLKVLHEAKQKKLTQKQAAEQLEDQRAAVAPLVETVSHCAECHSSRNAFGAIKSDILFAGGIDPQGTGFVPNITQQRLRSWGEADISTMLKTGETPKHGRVGSSMADVVANTAMLPEGDRQAIARYIKALPPIATPHP